VHLFREGGETLAQLPEGSDKYDIPDYFITGPGLQIIKQPVSYKFQLPETVLVADE
jgi:hypothetical protein